MEKAPATRMTQTMMRDGTRATHTEHAGTAMEKEAAKARSAYFRRTLEMCALLALAAAAAGAKRTQAPLR